MLPVSFDVVFTGHVYHHSFPWQYGKYNVIFSSVLSYHTSAVVFHCILIRVVHRNPPVCHFNALKKALVEMGNTLKR